MTTHRNTEFKFEASIKFSDFNELLRIYPCQIEIVQTVREYLPMGRQKRSSAALEQAERRSAAMRSIDENLDLGNGLKLADYDQLIQTVRGDIATYNELLSDSDRAGSAVKDGEKLLRDLSERMLIAVAAKYGKNSYEYEMAGGTRKSERKKPSRAVAAVG